MSFSKVKTLVSLTKYQVKENNVVFYFITLQPPKLYIVVHLFRNWCLDIVFYIFRYRISEKILSLSNSSVKKWILMRNI